MTEFEYISVCIAHRVEPKETFKNPVVIDALKNQSTLEELGEILKTITPRVPLFPPSRISTNEFWERG